MIKNKIILITLVCAAASQSCGCSSDDTGLEQETESIENNSSCEHPEVVENCADGWCEIPAGCFVWGSKEDTPCRGPYAEERVDVTLTRGFVIAQSEVTQTQWDATEHPNPSEPACADCPVNNLNWYEAMVYANYLSERDGYEPCYDLTNCTGIIGDGQNEIDTDVYKCDYVVHRYESYYDCPGYRLPTSAEWEYTAKAGTLTHTYAGDLNVAEDGCPQSEVLDKIAWYCFNEPERHVRSVMQKQPNAWGLYDTIGNAFEWVDHVDHGASLEESEQMDGPLIDPQGILPQDSRYLRGTYGGKTLNTCNTRATVSLGAHAVSRLALTGFRPVRTLFDK